jgi:hypothetical protein
VETVQNWNALMRAFMKEYYSLGKTQSLHNKIATFAQYPTKTISEAFEHFNEYTQAVPHHKFQKEDLVQKFYQGLTMRVKDDHRCIGGRIDHQAYTDRSFHPIQEGHRQ